MANDSITFFCSACGIRLTVPATLAGISGPCPSCRAPIQAPFPPQAPAATPVNQPQSGLLPPTEPTPSYQQPAYIPPSAAAAPAPPSYYQEPPRPPVSQEPYPAPPQQTPPAPVYAPPVQPAYTPPVEPYSPPPQPAPVQQPPYVAPPEPPPLQPAPVQQPVYTPPQQAAPVQQPVYTPPPGQPTLKEVDFAQPSPAAAVRESVPVLTPAVLRPEPRQLPSRQAHGEQPVAKQMPEPVRTGASDLPNPLPRHPHQRSLAARILMPLFFLLAVGLMVYGVRKVLQDNGKTPDRKFGESTVEPIIPELNTPPKKTMPEPEPAEKPLPVPPASKPSIIESPITLPEGMEPEAPGKAAYEVLEKFLAAKTLSERLPLMETKTPEAELAKSCLAGPLPASSNILTDAQETNAVEQVSDVYYNVDFDAGNKQTSPQTILVRSRGSSPPKVVVDPFLDSFGGRLAAYTSTPSEKAGVFQVIISAVASCNDERVPNREKKLTLKLLPRDNTKEIARAYFGRQSKIGIMLEDGTYSLSYGKAKACTVVLRWNTEDNPQTPYLEAIDLKTLDWNP